MVVVTGLEGDDWISTNERGRAGGWRGESFCQKTCSREKRMVADGERFYFLS